MKLTAQQLVLMTVMVWSFFGVVTKLLSGVKMDIVICIAFFASSLFNYLYARKYQSGFPLLSNYQLAFVTLFGYSIYWILYINCISSYTLSSMPVILNYTWPFFTGLFTILIYKRQKLDLGFGVTMLLGLLGIIVLQSKGELANLTFAESYIGFLFGIGSGISYGYYSAASSKVDQKQLPQFLFTGTFLSAIVMSIYVLACNDLSEIKISLYELLLAFGIGFFFESIGYICWTTAQSRAVEEKVDITKIVSLANYLPLLSLAWLGLFYKDERSFMSEPYFLISVMLIVGSSLIPYIFKRRNLI